MEIKNIQIYCNVNENGNIRDALTGMEIQPRGPYHFFFWETQEVADNITDYKVVLNKMVAELVLKTDQELEVQ